MSTQNFNSLAPRQREIAGLVSRGLSNKEIANEAGMTEATVKVHLKTLLGKLGLKNRTQLALWVQSDGGFDPSTVSVSGAPAATIARVREVLREAADLTANLDTSIASIVAQVEKTELARLAGVLAQIAYDTEADADTLRAVAQKALGGNGLHS